METDGIQVVAVTLLIMADEVVTFRCKRTVVSSRAVQVGQFYHPSVLDRTMEQNRLHLVFYYRLSTSGTRIGTTTAMLRKNLSELLCSYPVLTGRLLRSPEGNWMVKFNDAGVRMMEARAKGSVEEWLGKADRKSEMKLSYWEDMFHMPYFWSTFYFQVTEFEEGGLAIGLSCTHLLADATSATMLIKAWAGMSHLGTLLSPQHFEPLPPRSVCNKKPSDLNYLIHHYKSCMETTIYSSSYSEPDPDGFKTITFAFTEEMVQSCMAEVGGDVGGPTPFEALAGLFWVCISRAKNRKEGLINTCICMDMRKTLGLDNDFFGNAMAFNGVQGEGKIDGGGSVAQAAKAMADVVRKMGDEGVVMDLIEWLETTHGSSGHHLPPPMLCGPELVFANWEDMCPYSAAIFETGCEPFHFSYYLEPVVGEGQVLILPSPNGEGGASLDRVVMVTLPKKQAAMLCEDPLLHRFSPSLIKGMQHIEF